MQVLVHERVHYCPLNKHPLSIFHCKDAVVGLIDCSSE